MKKLSGDEKRATDLVVEPWKEFDEAVHSSVQSFVVAETEQMKCISFAVIVKRS